MGNLYLTLLGPPEVRHADQVLLFSTRKELALLLCLAPLQFEAGELEAAIETVNRWLVLAPLHEDAYQRLIRLHFAAGDRAAALHAYDTCRAMLATSMQTEPTPETVALASRMRAVAPPRRKEAPTPALALSPATFLDGPLLGGQRS